jgi:long-chain acyl-CoA synthetase
MPAFGAESGSPDPATAMPGAYAIAAQQPGKCAIIGPDGGQVTFGELGQRVNRLANVLARLGLKPGDTVASVQHNGISHFEVILAGTQVGLFVVPVNTHLTPAEASYIINDSGARAVIASHDLAAALDEVRDSLPEHLFAVGAPGGERGAEPPFAGGSTGGASPRGYWADYAALRESGAPAPPAQRIAGTVMGYTSGTSGRPKGVRRNVPPVEPELVINGILPFLARFGFRAYEGVHLVCAPLYHAAPLTFSLNLLHMGHTLVVHERFDAAAVLAALEEHRVTSTQMVPTHVHRLLGLPAEVKAARDTSSLEIVLVAGAPFPVHEKQEFLDWLGPVVWEYLAATEGVSSIVSPREAIEHPGTVGHPLPGMVVLLDDDGKEVPPGEAGTIWFQTGLARFEYHGDPDKTAKAVREDGLATVGDIGRLDSDGYLYLLDRRSDLIISGGVNVYPAEVEQRLLTHPAVADAAVIGLPDPDWGATVIAIVELCDGYEGSDALAADLDEHCTAGLARQKCPRRYEFRTELPRTPTGKLLRRKLRDELAA